MSNEIKNGVGTILAEQIKNDMGTILAERAKTHGKFSDNATRARRIIEVLYTGPYTDMQAFAVSMIVIKLARISSNPNVREHWLDIVGYATLILESMEEK